MITGLSLHTMNPSPQYTISISGRVMSSGARDAPIQLLVEAHDGRWYLQAPTIETRRQFHGPIFLGYADSEGEYRVMAVAGTKIKVPVLSNDELMAMDLVRSNILSVTRFPPQASVLGLIASPAASKTE